ncbi:branched-chain amino acid ABC transporter permease [Hyphomicrobium sp. CS1BSMeth3]|uniref:branched-chain amino acid ABC transporter permease n=1 Tax=Hyphomicrobium sp. CS1BSMeth3 TaxID=1892844 RepID=UPI000A6AC512|nr:branched-chain amino acid ABC transporter permease [Hyphomicrobium sp. CS1BSMeth3]
MMATRPNLVRDVAIAAVALIILLLLPYVWPSKMVNDLIIRVSAFALFATSLNLLVGYTGMVSFGHGMFFGFGAYAFGLSMQRLGVSIPMAFLITVVSSALLGLVVGAISIRLKDIYFSFITLAFQMLLYSTVIAWVPLTGGDQGLMGGIPRPPFLGIDLSIEAHRYAFAVTIMVIGLLILRQIVESPFGYTLRMIRDNSERATFLGINVFRAKLTAFVIAGVFGAIGGMVMALFVSGAYPEFVNWTMSGEGIFMIMLGGLSTFVGPAAGALILSLLNDVITRGTEHHGLFLGAVILLFALGLRKGVTDFVADWFRLRREASSRSGS